MSISVLIPSYDGKVSCATARSLVAEAMLAGQVGYGFKVTFLPGMSLVHAARNQLVYLFLNDADAPEKAVFVDADVGWQPGDMLRLATRRAAFVAGACRRKSEPEDYAINWLDGARTPDQNGLIEIETVGLAFAMIDRSLFIAFRDQTPELAYTFEGRAMHGFFECPIRGGEQIGEDVAFCRKWRQIGGKVHLDTTPALTHEGGQTSYVGDIGKWIERRKP